MKRLASECEYRSRVHSNDQSTGFASNSRCALLEQIVGAKRGDFYHVSQDHCDACCESFSPTPEDWNPVIISRVVQIGTQIMEQGGVEGCAQDRAEALIDDAITRLPVVNADEDDCADDLQHFLPATHGTFEELLQVLPLPQATRENRSTDRRLAWSTAITTAPRRQSTLEDCVQSLLASGWDDPKILVDGPVDIPPSLQRLVRKSRSKSIGAWPAWCDAVETLLEDQDRHDQADVFMIVQDDTLFPHLPVLRRYVDQLIWPENRSCIVSLYTSIDDTQASNAWRAYPDRWQYGALTTLMPPSVARGILESNRRGELNVVDGLAGIDTRLGFWAQRHEVPVWHPSPSLVQHIGQVSSIWSHSRAVGLRRAGRFIADEF